jgi:hypothetical protein
MPEDNFAQTCAAIILVVAMVRYATLTKLRSQGTDNRKDKISQSRFQRQSMS